MPLKRNIYRFLCISLALLSSIPSYTQSDTLRKVGGLTIGMDLSRFLVRTWNPVKSNFEFSISSDLYKNTYLTAEGGFLKTSFTDDFQTYESAGYYFRIGGEVNLFKRAPEENDLLYAGLLWGHSNFWHEAGNITIEDGYWGTGTGSLPRNDLTGNWLELKAGLRIEMFKNWFLGWALRVRFYMFGNTDPVLEPFLIPGFGRGDNTSAIGMSYSLSYRIPYHKSRKNKTK